MTRKAEFAGSFYKENFQELEEQIKGSFYSKLGPGDLPTRRTENRLRAVIVPHAGYAYSGPAAAWAYKKIGESSFPDTYILLGPNHKGSGSAISIEDWKTPIGFVKNDKDLARKIQEDTGIPINESSHEGEHSIEVQLPFLQFVSKDNLANLRIVPITIDSDLMITDFVKKLVKSINALKREVTFIVSSDFTHYGRVYGYIPFEEDAQSRVKEMDLKAISHIKKKDVKSFLNHIEETQSTICGQIPIIILLQALGKYDAELEIYYTSAEMTGDPKNSVSYASITFK